MVAIKATDPQSREHLLPWPYGPRSNGIYTSIHEQFSRILRRAGLPTTAKDKFHKIRRTSATYLTDVVGIEEAQKHLGHSRLSVTERYIDPTKLKQRVNAADVIARPDWKGAG